MRVNSSYTRTLLDVFVVVEESDLAESEKTLEKNSPESRSTQAAPLVSPVHERFFPSADRISEGSLFKNVTVGVSGQCHRKALSFPERVPRPPVPRLNLRISAKTRTQFHSPLAARYMDTTEAYVG